MEELAELGHLLVFAFLFSFASFMVAPVITDVTMEALCPGRDECSLAIYLAGLQQAVTGLGALVVMPVIGNLSDRYGRKALLALPAMASIVPLGILAYNRSKAYFYAYYITKTLTAMASEGAMQCLSIAYVADRVPETRRAAAFGVFSGVCTAGFVGGTIAARFLSVSSTFQVCTREPCLNANKAVAAAVYMRAFLQETDGGASRCDEDEASRPLCLPSSSSEEVSPRLPPLRKSAVPVGDGYLSYQQLCLKKFKIYYAATGNATLSAKARGAEAAYHSTFSELRPWNGSRMHHWNKLDRKRDISSNLYSSNSCCCCCNFSPFGLTAWFLSETAPFNFKGFSIACSGFATLVALAMSINMRPAGFQQPDRK
ncbi:hypothetical protein PR202_ga07728 [Eleusine coracana subsp. coracana]|uniref:Major facilitator superfamily (MFS) profile domain-containing protein n=1 Tax=Eleusine coracana subsp. coracana TaxID=191504 RepID=A0AAV5BYI4_ELECO|nr:hypothetical protein PR202_ga07728 [Eleusine coracana subsp. coracana]